MSLNIFLFLFSFYALVGLGSRWSSFFLGWNFLKIFFFIWENGCHDLSQTLIDLPPFKQNSHTKCTNAQIHTENSKCRPNAKGKRHTGGKRLLWKWTDGFLPMPYHDYLFTDFCSTSRLGREFLPVICYRTKKWLWWTGGDCVCKKKKKAGAIFWWWLE